jgi:hypothetical protein
MSLTCSGAFCVKNGCGQQASQIFGWMWPQCDYAKISAEKAMAVS